ncbi:MAG: bifunctional UDP-N-acetylmuramoyl-tripeptide:D-alanyl-D-alanine ligase/alanine racemase [Ginsengibacter sp.]
MASIFYFLLSNFLFLPVNVNIYYSVDQIANLTGGSLLNYNAALAAPSYLSLDSRKIIFPEDTIFFAIKTRHHDGNAFIEGLYVKGVRNFVTDDENIDIGTVPHANVIVVNNSVHALQMLASHYRSRFNKLPRGEELPVVGITGSNGKTIVKEWLNQLLAPDYVIVRSPKSYNSQIGVPLSVLLINSSHTLAIFEAGISTTGEMKQLEKVIKPAIGLFTNIGQAHDEGFGNRIQKINEKLKLFVHARHLIFCADNNDIKNAVVVFQKKLKNENRNLQLFSWGKGNGNRLRVSSIEKSNIHTKIEAIYKREKISITIPFTDDASVENAINCWCVLLVLNKNDAKARKRFRFLYPIAMRLELKQGVNHCTIINDSYSNDLHSLAIALDFLEQQKQHKKHTVVLSDILQTGQKPDELYKEVADLLRHKKIDTLVGIGPDIFLQQNTFQSLNNSQFFLTVEEFLKNMPVFHFHDETVLIKGARCFGFEEIARELEQKVHQTILSINLNAIVHNLKQYKQLLNPPTKIMAMVKAFSYGSGSYEIASVLEFHKVDYLAVAYADEGVELRKAGITLPIMVMNAETSTFESIVNNNLEPEIFSFSILNEFERFLESSGINYYPVHLKIDTGMHRLGFTGDDMSALSRALGGNTLVKVVTMFTHLVAGDNTKENDFTHQQAMIFEECCNIIEHSLGYKFIKHVANTAGISHHLNLQMDMVRLGIGLYGIDSNKRMQSQLKNVTTLTTTVSQIKKIKEGDTVGYGRNAKLTRDSLIATVRVGYADGYPRNLGNGKGKMLLHNTLVPVVGNVCMDMTMLDITGLDMIKEGDEVVVFGEALPLYTLAGWAETIPYELMTGISQRVKRVYFEE